MKRRFFGYVVVCDGCCTDLKWDGSGEDWKDCSEKVTASSPHYPTRKEAEAAGLKVVTRKRAGWKACKTKWGASWKTDVPLENLGPNAYRVFTYEMK